MERVHQGQFETLSLEDQTDLRSRHKSRQLSLAEFIGLLGSNRLIPLSFPLAWMESLLRPLTLSLSKRGVMSNHSNIESAVELICRVLRGIDCPDLTCAEQVRISSIIETLSDLPKTSTRIRCVIQDAIDLKKN